METNQRDCWTEEEHTGNQRVDSPGKINLREAWKCFRQFGAIRCEHSMFAERQATGHAKHIDIDVIEI